MDPGYNWYSSTSNFLQNNIGIAIPWIDMNTGQAASYPDKYIAYSQNNDTFCIKFDTSQFGKTNTIEVLVKLYLDNHARRPGDIEIHYQQAAFLRPYPSQVPIAHTQIGISYGSVGSTQLHTTDNLTSFTNYLITNGVGSIVSTNDDILLEEIFIDNNQPAPGEEILIDLTNRLFRFTFT